MESRYAGEFSGDGLASEPTAGVIIVIPQIKLITLDCRVAPGWIRYRQPVLFL